MSDMQVERNGPATLDSRDLVALMQAAVDAVIVIDSEGRIIAFSRSAEEMFGYSAAQIAGEPIEILMPEPHRSRHAGYVEHYLGTGQAKVIGIGRQVDAIRRTGEVFPVWLSVGEANTSSGTHFVGIVRDLTEQRKAELERHALEIRLAHVGRLSLLGEMAAGIAHEINQPLTAISNYSQAARNILERGGASSEHLRTACAGISEQVRRAGEVISNLRKFVRRREIEKLPLNLRALIEGVMVLVNADAAHGGVRVETVFAEGLPDIYGNAVQLQQVLLNLTRNAVDAMRGNVGKAREMRIETRPSGADTVAFLVSDSGPGVSASLEEAIFHPFFTTKPEGLGVGLAISRSIVEAHGGTLTCEQSPGGGATFVASLPILSGDE